MLYWWLYQTDVIRTPGVANIVTNVQPPVLAAPRYAIPQASYRNVQSESLIHELQHYGIVYSDARCDQFASRNRRSVPLTARLEQFELTE